jgi:PadR family transcriptional regulator, regulatory protein PadR
MLTPVLKKVNRLSQSHIEEKRMPHRLHIDRWHVSRTPPRKTRQLLTAMLRQPHTWQYGYELSKPTGLKSGTLYPLLMRVSDQGLPESKWQEPERLGKPSHAYKLTPNGSAFAH